jgi:hypothetical protein
VIMTANERYVRDNVTRVLVYHILKGGKPNRQSKKRVEDKSSLLKSTTCFKATAAPSAAKSTAA